MGLRTRLFLFFGGLMAVLVTAELWLVRRLAGDLEQEVGAVALEVGSEVLRFFGSDELSAPSFPDGRPAEVLARDLRTFAAPAASDRRELEIGLLTRFESEVEDDPRERRVRVRPMPLGSASGGFGEGTVGRPRVVGAAGTQALDLPGTTHVIALGGRIGAAEGSPHQVLLDLQRAQRLDRERRRLVVLRDTLVRALEEGELSAETEARLVELEAQEDALMDLEEDLRDLELWSPTRGRVEVRVQETGPGGEGTSFLTIALEHESLFEVLHDGMEPAHDLLVEQLLHGIVSEHDGTQHLDPEDAVAVAGREVEDPHGFGAWFGTTPHRMGAEHALTDRVPHAGSPAAGFSHHDDAEHEVARMTPAAAPRPTPATAPATQDLVRVPIRRSGVVQAIERFLRRLLLGSAGILGTGLLVAAFAAHRVTHPLRDLARAARDVGAGALGEQVPDHGEGEVRQTIRAFNAMSSRLATLDREARELREREHLSELGEVARGVAHSLRNPLNALGLTVDALALRAGDVHGELAETARAQIRRVDRTLRTLLTLAGSGSGAASTPVSLVDEARDVALELVQEGVRGVAVRVETSPGVPSLPGVGAELRAVVHVLVVNAVEASPEGGEVLVRVEPTADGQGVLVRVLDRGCGVPPELRPKLFAPHTTTKEQGAGMGLYLARRIATSRYGGSLELEDRAGGGIEARLVLHARGEANRG